MDLSISSCSARSSKALLPCTPVVLPPLFNLEALLAESTQGENRRISAYEDRPNNKCQPDNSALSALHDLPYVKPSKAAVLPSPLRPTPQRLPAAWPAVQAHVKGVNDSHKRRAKKRKAKKALFGQIPRPETLAKHIKPALPINTKIDLPGLPACAGAYCAKSAQKTKNFSRQYAVEELKGLGVEVIPWDAEEDRPFIDKNGQVLAVAVAIPKCPRYRKAIEATYEAIMEEGSSAQFSEEESNHRRGSFPAINVGVTHGKGTLKPVNLDNKSHTGMARRLLAHTDVQRMAGYASASFAAWAPDVYSYYKQRLDILYARRPELVRNFESSVYPSAAFNFGPNVWTHIHRDVLNCPFGWCAIQALGRFDPQKGGHLILWDLMIAIEFPPGSLILIPSATLAHSNVPVAPGESRVSFTQYAAGGLFRYVDYGLRTEKELRAEDPVLYKEVCRLRPERWRMGLNLLSNLQDIQR